MSFTADTCAIAGTWTYERTSKHIALTIHPFNKLNKQVQNAIEREATHLAK